MHIHARVHEPVHEFLLKIKSLFQIYKTMYSISDILFLCDFQCVKTLMTMQKSSEIKVHVTIIELNKTNTIHVKHSHVYGRICASTKL